MNERDSACDKESETYEARRTREVNDFAAIPVDFSGASGAF
jgi:hypothetical protein